MWPFCVMPPDRKMLEPEPLALVSRTVFATRIRLWIRIGLLLVRIVPPALVTRRLLLSRPPSKVSTSVASLPSNTLFLLLKATLAIAVVEPVSDTA